MTNQEFVRQAYAIAEACCDVFRLEQGRIQLFDCYPSGTVILAQLGVLGNLDGVVQQHASVWTMG